MGRLSKHASERIYYGTWVCVRGFERGLKEGDFVLD